ncbi:ArsR/SmtB family transcription factor [Halobellus limi]|jgi:predicted transcriptional regulator|uniref:Helix-turn-helix domain-containing protein n=1 Tax=Halobellus limi TaxID=699433 RepID=A0A1H5UHP8_9EURY|nr:helix-turn-helix domain-containing protein [Halobellus limi]QCC47050.1 winged helix-turn-helix transcriptional regulator [Halobellus limi]SEF73787.1 Helix-turn-helix domain-containing protein [Halobellus limi]
MAGLLPSPRSIEQPPQERTEVVVDGSGSGTVFTVLASETAHTILGALREEPRPVSAIAETVETSLQNTRYHVERLCEAGFVEPVDTRYSAKGREMTVYGLRVDRLVIRFEDGSQSAESTAD